MAFPAGAPSAEQALPPQGVESLHECGHTRITRLALPGPDGHPVRVVRKEVFGSDPGERLGHEQAMLERLHGVAGITPLAKQQPYPDSLVLADVDGRCLDTVPTPLEPARLAAIATALTGTIAEMHRRGVVHRDINPANILLADSGGRGPPRPYLIDFALATTATELRPDFTHLNEIGGALPYLAPEQTGRVGWPVDQRADLYALGATLYELATGAPPFGRDDPLRLSHDHLAQVPTPPHQVNPEIGPTLSAIIMHLLEKEPDNRYQSAEGLLHDLRQLTAAHPDGTGARIGESDHPARLHPTSRLIGRDPEVAAITSAFTEAVAGRSRVVLISGPPGVGKTALIDELRSVVTASNGWFIAGKSDQYRRDQEFEAVWQAFQQLGRLLLAEPEDELETLRHRLREELGPDAGLLAALHSQFETLLQVRPVPVVDDPLTNQARLQHIGAVVLRVVASPQRPVVLALDDLQWAGRTPLGLVDAIVSEGGPAGLLLVGAYREQDLNGTHPLPAMVSRWQAQANDVGLVQLELGNLSRSSVADLLTDVLRLPPQRAAALAQLLEPYVDGNPNDTVELLKSLRREDLLSPDGGAWRWDPESIRRRLEGAVIADLVAARADALPPATRSLVQAMACLGGRAELAVLQSATGAPAAQLEQWLAPALDDGLLVTDAHGQREGVRFRHDRVQEVVLRRLPADEHDALRLRLARRLARVPGLFAVAAEQYLPVVGLVSQPRERRQVADLLRRAAAQAQLLSAQHVVERCLTAAAQLIDPAQRTTLIEVHTGRQAALYNLGRLEEADEAYDTAMRLCDDPMDQADATLVQVSSLTNRNRAQEAVQLGLDLLARLGHPAPGGAQLGAEVEQGLDAFGDWFRQGRAADPHRCELTDPRLLKVGALINRMMPPAYFTDHVTMSWLALRAWEIWVKHGPGRTLVGPVSHIPYAIMVQRDDLRTAHAASRQVLAASEAHGYEPGTSQSRFLYALAAWSQEPLEECLRHAELAREGLTRGGDLQNACYSRHVTFSHLFECGPSLAECGGEVAAALTFAERTGNERFAAGHRIYQELVRSLRGEATGQPMEQILPETLVANPTALVHLHLARALLAALFGNQEVLQTESAELMSYLPMITGTYPTCVAHLLRGLALAEATRTACATDRPGLLSQLDQEVEWFGARAGDSPENLLHLLRLVEAERSWAAGEQRAAIGAFDAAVREVSGRRRPWHRALTLERAARYHLSQGLEHTGHLFLAQARQAYHDWGAGAKVRQLDWAYPTLEWDLRPSAAVPTQPRNGEPVNPSAYRPGVTSGSIDLLGIHAASQVLNSETTVHGLRGRIVEVLGGMTGASAVQLLLWGEEEQGWLAAAPEGESEPVVGLSDAQNVLPVSAIRYVERTGEPLVVADATRDDRFARDPYLEQLGTCSLMVVPVRSRGELQAILVLENRLIRNAFTAERLEAVMLIAGQLAVSLRNAIVYSSLERKVAARTEELALANHRLERLSITDPLTGLPNRRRLETVLAGEWERGQRARAPLALAMVDIDHFKPYNDHYGHLAGDRCLQRVSAMLTRHLREGDLAARYGGEEFAVVMPGMTLPEAVRDAERLRAAVVALDEPHPPVPEGLVTVSIGVAAMVPPVTGRVSQLTALADTELYRAKHAGRNRVWPVLPPQRDG